MRDRQLDFENRVQRVIEVEHTVNVISGLVTLIGFLIAYFHPLGWLVAFLGFVMYGGSLVAYINQGKHQMEGYNEDSNIT